MKVHGHPRIQAEVCGLFLHPIKGWLAASPYAQVKDPHVPLPYGIADIKSPFSKADVTVKVAYRDIVFYCIMDTERNNLPKITSTIIKFNCSSGASWCNFCVYTPKDIAIEQIYPDDHWQHEEVPKLNSFL